MLCCPKVSWCVEREITDVEVVALKNVKKVDIQADGFNDLDDLFSKLKEYYPDVTLDEPMTVVKWK